MKNDIKSKNFIVIRRYKPEDDDFFDDNPVDNNTKNHSKFGGFHKSYMDVNNQEELEQEHDTNVQYDKTNSNQNYNQENDYKEDNTEQLLNISDIDITNMVVNFDLNLNIFDPYDLYDSYNNNDYNDYNGYNDNNDNEFNNFFGET